MILNLIADRIVKGKIYPALAVHQAEPYTASWREFTTHWPYTVPLRLQEYCDNHNVFLNIVSIEQNWPSNSFYPIGIGFFDFNIDYFFLLPKIILENLQKNKIKILFYYHEGDNPQRIQKRLDALCKAHNLPLTCYVFVTSNSAAIDLSRFIEFQDSELWYYQRNLRNPALFIHNNQRSKNFTILNRLHKSWRALIMADLLDNKVLNNSYWSYCETGIFNDNDCPIEIDAIHNLRNKTEQFLASAPYICDQMNNDQRNDHSTLVEHFYQNSYCNIVVESQFDFDQSNGVLLSEKTFKPIKHGQLFFVAGACGSLDKLRQLGYKVFDDIVDNSYDQEKNHTRRWLKLKQTILTAQNNLPEIFAKALPDIEHNQQQFVAVKTQRLNNLVKEINEYC